MLRLARLQVACALSSGGARARKRRRASSPAAPASLSDSNESEDEEQGELQLGLGAAESGEDSVSAQGSEEAQDDAHISAAVARVGEKHKLVRALRPSETFLFHGRVLLRVLEGRVRIYGHVLGAGRAYHALYAPHDFAALGVEALPPAEAGAAPRPHERAADAAAPDEEAESDEEGAAGPSPPRRPQRAPRGAVAALVVLKCAAADAAAWARGAHVAGVSRRGSGRHMRLPGMEEVSEGAARALRVPEEWEAAAEACLGPRAADAVVAVCGAKDSGKSTLCRYLLNRALNAHGAAAYLETDLGQSEFTPPGLVSLTLLAAPLFGPPHTHLREPLRAVFVGETTPQRDPALYLRAVRFAAATHAARVPLVVNTHGWVQGLGRDLLLEVLRAVAPTAVLQIGPAAGAASARRALAPLEPAAFGAPPDVRVIALRSAAGPSRGGALGAAEARALQVASYLARCSPLAAGPARPPAACSPAEGRELLAWAGVELCRVAPTRSRRRPPPPRPPRPVPRSQAYYAFNAALVALVADPRPMRPAGLPAAPGDEPRAGVGAPLPHFLAEPPLAHCEGLGIVRGIDTARGVLHILTPVPPARLARVNTLVRGALALPPPLLAQGPSRQDQYVVSEHLTASTAGAAPLRPRPNLDRKRLSRPAP
eukprot:tig00000388_g24821.t1